jgi:hypothetical protein
MVRRVAGMVVLIVLTVGIVALTAAPVLGAEAAEGAPAEEVPAIDEIGTGSQASQEFNPEPYEAPSFFRFITYPLLAVGIVAVLVIGFLYLRNLPRFAEEARTRRRR